ncbi:androgen-binding protein homolog [Sarcophilus harrisii]|uniref:androgen-binding protein homolog n=1 Tax=Sarcophilus harrisii TaxID=9305 RepID=UPI000226D5E0|nr:androgen-binding protein homolog [Sarcophilus harrisii]
MKITSATFSLLLVLALCSQYAESCLPFYITFGTVALRNSVLLKLDLIKYGATQEEYEAFRKIQECYAEHPIIRTAMDIKLMTMTTINKECYDYLLSSFGL